MKLQVILASASPRRKTIFKDLNIDAEIILPNVNEDIDKEGVPPEIFTQELALLKGSAAAKQVVRKENTVYLVVSADTVVVLDGEIIGKPESREHAKQMLQKFSGRTHEVVTGICLWKLDGKDDRCACAFCKTKVTFKPLTESETEAYLDSGEYKDKAGAYGIQEKGGAFVEKIEGDYFNVVGFPTEKFFETVNNEFSPELYTEGGIIKINNAKYLNSEERT